MTDHVPAWKRLGLKLKYASDLPAKEQHNSRDGVLNEQPSSEAVSDLKRKAGTDLVQIAKKPSPSKKARLANGTSQIDTSEAISTPSASSGQAKRKKSVTFTSDTKIDATDTAQRAFVVTPASPGSRPDSSRKKVKKPKSERQQHTPTHVPAKPHAAVRYLNQHFHDRASWKFNKNREVWILKHVFSAQDLPAEVNSALANYIHGLQSFRARLRLKKECMEANTLSSSQADLDNVSDAEFAKRLQTSLAEGKLQSYEAGSQEFSAWIKNQPRAAITLLALGESASTLASELASESRAGHSDSLSNGSQKPRVKKSKARTSRIDVESESSSDSDESSDSDTSSPASNNEVDDETSSDGTSDSDSASDDTSSSNSSSD